MGMGPFCGYIQLSKSYTNFVFYFIFGITMISDNHMASFTSLLNPIVSNLSISCSIIIT
jgi:hypothetical protein